METELQLTMAEFARKYDMTQSMVFRHINLLETIKSEHSIKPKIFDNENNRLAVDIIRAIKRGVKKKVTI
jgi:hypothetical protein